MPPKSKNEETTGIRWGVALLWVAFAAALTRGLFWWTLDDHPLLQVPLGDALAYLEWSARIAGGDPWGLAVGTFYQAPLYPYFLAAVQCLVGEAGEPAARTLAATRAIQMAGGMGACLLLAATARRLAGPTVGLVAGLFMAGYPPAWFYEVQVDKTALAHAGLCLVLYLGVRLVADIAADRGRRRALALGATIGVVALLRENLLLVLPALAAWLYLDRSLGARRQRVMAACGVLVGAALVLVPVAGRNLAVGGSFALTTAQAGPNLYIGNRIGATGSYTPLLPMRGDARFEREDARALAEADLGRALGDAEISRYWVQRTLADIAAQPWGWLRLMARKSLMAANAYEMPDVEDPYLLFDAQRGAWLALTVWHFGILLPLAVLGGCLLGKPSAAWRPVWIVLGVAAVTLVAFFIFGRYRFVLVPPLVLLAAVGAVRGWKLLDDAATVRASWRIGGIVLVTAFLANLPVAWLTGVSNADARVQSRINLGVALASLGRLDAAEAEYRKALVVRPDYPDAEANLGSLLVVTGRLDEGIALLERAAATARDAELLHHLGLAYEARARARAHPQDLLRAAAALEVAARLDPASEAIGADRERVQTMVRSLRRQ